MLKNLLITFYKKYLSVIFNNEYVQIFCYIVCFFVILHLHRVFLQTYSSPSVNDSPKMDSTRKEHFFIYRKALEAQCAKEGYILNPKFLNTVDSTAEAIAK